MLFNNKISLNTEHGFQFTPRGRRRVYAGCCLSLSAVNLMLIVHWVKQV